MPDPHSKARTEIWTGNPIGFLIDYDLLVTLCSVEWGGGRKPGVLEMRAVRGQKITRNKTEYMSANQTQRWKGDDAKVLRWRRRIGLTVLNCAEKRGKRGQAGWSGWKRVTTVTSDWRAAAKGRGKVYKLVVRIGFFTTWEMVALTKTVNRAGGGC